MSVECDKPTANDNNDKSTLVNSPENNQADAQILAHQAQHQQRIKKLVLAGVAFILFILACVITYKLVTSSPTEDANTAANKQTIIELSPAEINVLRDQFQQALTRYEIDIQPQIDDINFVRYEPAQSGQLALIKEQMLSAFANGAFSEAKTSLERLIEDSQALIEQWDAEFSAYLKTANAAFDADQIPQSRLALNKAMALKPTELQALALQSRLDAYGEISTLMDDLKVAKIENNLPKQIDLLSSIIGLDPARQELNDDLSDTKEQYDGQRLQQYLLDAEHAIEQNNINEALSLIAKAKEISPASKGAKALEDRISVINSQRYLQQLLADISAQQVNDNWQQVQALANKGLMRFTGNTQLQKAQQQAQSITQHQRTLQTFISRPNRLSDNNIRQAASNAMQAAVVDSLASASLQNTIAELGKLVDTYSAEVPVTVISDAKTYVVVVGVGHVGEHLSKEIKLSPGKYVLEGRREGYRAKRIEITVKANKPLSVEVICNEPI